MKIRIYSYTQLHIPYMYLCYYLHTSCNTKGYCYLESFCFIYLPFGVIKNEENYFLYFCLIASSQHCQMLYLQYTNKYIIGSHCCFNFSFSNDNVEYLFTCILTIHLSSLICVQAFCPFIKNCVIFLFLSFQSSLYIVVINPLAGEFANIVHTLLSLHAFNSYLLNSKNCLILIKAN